MSKKIQELVSVPISLSVETVIDGEKFYSSENLKKNFVLAFEKSSKGNHISNEISKLVQDEHLILPCYRSKNLFGFIKRKISPENQENYILGFYHITEKKVVVLIENSLSIFGTAANDDLVSTTIHECMHMVAGRDLNKFLNIFKNHLKSYYLHFYEDYFKTENTSLTIIDNIIKFISSVEIKGVTNINKFLSEYHNILTTLKDTSSLETLEFDRRLQDIIIALKLFMTHMPTLLNNYRRFIMIFTSLNRSYQTTFGKRNIYTTPIQELLSTSEIACVFSEMKSTDPVIKRLLRIIV